MIQALFKIIIRFPAWAPFGKSGNQRKYLIANTFPINQFSPATFPRSKVSDAIWRKLSFSFAPINYSPYTAQESLFGYVRDPLRKLFFYFTPINIGSPGNPPPQYWTTERPPELLACPGALLRIAQIAKSQECYMGAQSPYYSR